MFLGRYNRFKCNDCGAESFVTGFPEEWVFSSKGLGPPEHYCDICKHKPENKAKGLKTPERKKVKA